MEGKQPNKWESLSSSSVERSYEEALRFLMTINLTPADFIGTKEDGYKLTAKGDANKLNLASLVSIDYEVFKTPIKDRDYVCFYFAERKRVLRQDIGERMEKMKKDREEASKPQGMGLPSFLEEEGDNEGDNSNNGA
jgi:hypothetical protein